MTDPDIETSEYFRFTPELYEVAAMAIYEQSKCGEKMCGPERHCYCRASAKAALDAVRWYYESTNAGTPSGNSD